MAYAEEWSDRLVETIAAFANTCGGTLFVGVDDQENVVGLDDLLYTETRIYDALTRNMVSCFTVDRHQLNGVHYLSVSIPRRDYSCRVKGRYYIVDGGEIRTVIKEEYRLFRNYFPMEGWSASSSALRKKDILPSVIENFENTSGEGAFAEYMSSMDPGLDVVSNGTALAFGKGPLVFHVDIWASYGRERFHADALSPPFSESFSYLEGTILHAWSLVARYKGLDPGFPYPMDAVKEALVNAIVNHDYNADRRISIEITDDSLRVENAGSPPPGLDLAMIREGSLSYPRSRELLATFRLMGLARGKGQGIQRMVDAYSDTGLESPVFSYNGNVFTVLFLPIRRRD